MIRKIIQFCVFNPVIVLSGVILLIIWGLWSMVQLPLDAVPDITNNQVQIVTFSPALSAEEVEFFITAPVERKMANLPGIVELRSITRYGLSVITVVFKDNIDILRCRQLVSDQLNILGDEIPAEYGKPEMLPITTGLGEIYQYVLKVDPSYVNQYTLYDLRTIHDWVVKKYLSGVEGIIDISSLGGYVKQYEIAYKPERLHQLNISVDDIINAVRSNNASTGSGYVTAGDYAVYLKSDGRARSELDLQRIPLSLNGPSVVLLSHVADVRTGHAMRYGATTMDGKGEVVGGITMMLKDQSSSKALKNVHERIEKIQQILPPGISIEPFLDRSDLIDRTIFTVVKNLTEGALIVIVVLVLFLGSFKAAVITSSIIPLSMLFAFGLMRFFGVSANLMSLGAIDFGIIVDGAVIVTEGVIHFFELRKPGIQPSSIQNFKRNLSNHTADIYSKAIFGVLIILLVLLPVLSFEGVEGKMFRPMVLTVSFALIGSFILSITYVPMLCALWLKPTDRQIPLSVRMHQKLERLYIRYLSKILGHTRLVISAVVILFAVSVSVLLRRGAEFIPSLEEGDLALQMLIEPGSSLEKMIETTTAAEKLLMEKFPEIRHVVSKIGAPEVPTDPMAIEEADVMILLKPKKYWVSTRSKDGLVEAMKRHLESNLSGVQMEFSQPIQLRFNELLSGSKSDITIKVMGEDREILNQIAAEIYKIASATQGAADVKLEKNSGLPIRVFEVNRQMAAATNIQINQINTAIQSMVAGVTVNQLYENERNFDVVVRMYDPSASHLPMHLIPVKGSASSVPLSNLVYTKEVNGARQISRERGMRKVEVGINVRGRDINSVIGEIDKKMRENILLPSGVMLDYGGQFENLQSAISRLSVVVPVILFIIFVLLYMAFNSLYIAVLVFSVVPMASIGGIFSLLIRDMPFSISAAIGFIALFGVAVLNGVVLLAVIIDRLKQPASDTDLKKILIDACTSRLRPVLMTGTVASLGFLPMAVSSSAGAEVQRPLATVVIGGLVTATFLTLFVLPSAFYLFKHGRRKISMAVPVVLALLLVEPAESHAQKIIRSISLAEAIELGLQNNPLIRGSITDIDIARLEKSIALDPGSTSAMITYGQINFARNDYSIEILQNIQSIGKQIASYKRADIALNLSNNRLQLAEKTLKRQVTALWYQWLFAKWTLKLYEQEDHQYQSMRPALDALKANGALKPLDIMLLENRFKEVSLRSNLIAGQMARLSGELKSLIGLPAEVELEPSDSVVSFHFVTDSQALSDTHLQNLELLQSLARSNYLIQKQSFFPDLQIGYFNQSLEGFRGFQGIMMGVQIPLVPHATLARIKQSRYEWQKARELSDYRKNELQNTLFTLMESILELQNQLREYSEFQKTFSQQMRSTAYSEFRKGSISVFEFLQSLSQSVSTEINYLNILLQYQLLLNELNFLTDEK